jgi:putative thioredoxin
MADVTDATFQSAVLDRSQVVPVVVDLWAPWCGPCRTLGPILEKVVGATEGKVELAKVNVDENPQVASAFQVQSIPAVFAVSGQKVVDGFVGALPEHQVAEFVARLTGPPSEVAQLIAAGDESSLRAALELEPGNETAVLALAGLLIEKGESEDALALLGRVAESPESRRLAALARLKDTADEIDVEARLTELLDRVKSEPDTRQEFLDLLETLGPSDPRSARYRREFTSRIF